MIRSLLGNTSFPYAQQHVLFSAKEKQRENRITVFIIETLDLIQSVDSGR